LNIEPLNPARAGSNVEVEKKKKGLDERGKVVVE
jgi:hypothetical protein